MENYRIINTYIKGAYKKICTRCEGKYEYKITSRHAGFSTENCSFGAGLAASEDVCSRCGTTGNKGISSDIVGGCW